MFVENWYPRSQCFYSWRYSWIKPRRFWKLYAKLYVILNIYAFSAIGTPVDPKRWAQYIDNPRRSGLLVPGAMQQRSHIPNHQFQIGVIFGKWHNQNKIAYSSRPGVYRLVYRLVHRLKAAFTPDTCSRLQVSGPSNLYPDTSGYMLPIQDTCRRRQAIQMDTTCIWATCIRCKRGISLTLATFSYINRNNALC